jgi:protein arginine kinase activator
MTCNLCGTQEATIHLTEIVNNQMIEIHLCETCAQEKGTEFKTHFQLGDLMGSLMGMEKAPKASEKKLAARCPECGLSYEEFGKTGRLGCAFCYEAFSKLLLPLIKRVQRSTQHTGKKPSKVASSVIPSPQPPAGPDLKILQERLKKSIQMEAFEEAARLRDEIKQLEDKKKPKKNKE